MTHPQIRSVLQFVSGPRRGLLAQVCAVENGVIKCLSREVDSDRAHFFDVGPEDAFTVCGSAVLGPKGNQAPQPVLPPALDPQALLEPLPADVKAVPMGDENVPPLLPPLPDPEPAPPLPKKPKVKAKKKPASPANPPTYRRYNAVVENGLGGETKVMVSVRDGRPLYRYIGSAVMAALAAGMPKIKPYKVEFKAIE